MNCTKQESWRLVDKYWEREWEKIKQIDFPKTREFEITDRQCANELVTLRDNFLNNKTQSRTIIKFHKSLIFANRKRCLSPYEYWQKLKVDSDLFRAFYENRLRCSDWYNEKNGANFHYLNEGYVPEFIYGIGLSTSRKAPTVSYFKPALAKNLIMKYAADFDTIFDPCSGYSGRLIGTLCCGKNYIGQDINDMTVDESKYIFEYIKPLFKGLHCEINLKDSLEEKGKYDCMLTCTPYEDIEVWMDSLGNRISNTMTCDQWIDCLLENYDCKRYLFVTDGNIIKYRNNVIEVLENTSHFGRNSEFVVRIDK